MATAVLKRKRENVATKPAQTKKAVKKAHVKSPSPADLELQTEVQEQRLQPPKVLTATTHPEDEVAVQIVAGSYDRVLHGICARIPSKLLNKSKPAKRADQKDASTEDVSFSDTFLFAAHASSIRCLALSPPTSDSDKRILATGGSDERINLYNLSTAPPAPASKSKVSLKSTPRLQSSTSNTVENPRNRSLGNLIHHERPITNLYFPTRAKLFSAAEDNNIAISRTRDWTVLSSIKAPVPKPQGRPSGDTAAPGEVPAGVNDFAIHPSQKLMLSVGRGEKCMRLWNLMTGKKAGVLNFEREVLAMVGESRYASGEGLRVLWDEDGEIFVVGFERGAVVFGIDSKPRAIVKTPAPSTKFHQMRFLPKQSSGRVLAVSTEDGRILFFDMSKVSSEEEPPADVQKLPQCSCIAQLGGQTAGNTNRIKDFEVLQLPPSGEQTPLVIVTASSDGAIRLWAVFDGDLKGGKGGEIGQVGRLAGSVETWNRITCLGAFVLDGKGSGEEQSGSDEDEDEESE